MDGWDGCSGSSDDSRVKFPAGSRSSAAMVAGLPSTRTGSGLLRRVGSGWSTRAESVRPAPYSGCGACDEPVSGGALVTGAAGTLGFADFHLDRDSTTHWFSTSALLAPGVTTLAGTRSGSSKEVAAVRTSGAPRYVQGGDVDTGRRPYLTVVAVHLRDADHAGGGAAGVRARAEGVAFDGRGGLWAVLESGARNYQRDGRGLVPSLVRFDVDQLSRGVDETCSW